MSGQPEARERQLILEEQARQNQVIAFTGLCTAVADCIREIGDVPSGHLYARLMGRLSLEQYEAIIGTLIDTGLVHKAPSHMLTWIGLPKEKEKV